MTVHVKYGKKLPPLGSVIAMTERKHMPLLLPPSYKPKDRPQKAVERPLSCVATDAPCGFGHRTEEAHVPR